MNGIWIKRLGSHRGRRRLWLETRKLISCGMQPGARFRIDHMSNGVRLRLDEAGTHQVSRKMKGERELPVIDVNSDEWLMPLKDCEVVRVVLREDAIYVLRPASEMAKAERLSRLQKQLASGNVRTASLAHGGGVLSNACHAGLKEAGLHADLRFAVEIDEGYMEQSLAHNDATGARTAALVVPLQELVQDEWAMGQLPKVEVLEMGLPCSGASKAGKSKRGLSMMEDHPEVGHLVHAALAVIQKIQPAAVVLENVETYATTASAQILRHQLRDMGYEVREHVLDARDFGSMEARIRWALVATTAGITPLEAVEKSGASTQTLGDFLDDVPADDPSWSGLDYLKEKEVRDAEAGKGFKMQTVNADSTSVPTIRKSYNKGGSTDPFVEHPSQAGLLRKFTPSEHARIKGVPEHLVKNLPATTAHELLGQGIAYAPFRSLFKALGQALQSAKDAAAAAATSNLAPLGARMEAVTG